ncbi:MAG TPA: hypothetical protein VFV39_05070 [Limnobacter sp.]|nr:hypothetical protein [Limnobacter sp.]
MKPFVHLIPDVGALLELQRQQALGSLFKAGWSVGVPDAVLHVLVRHDGPEGLALVKWIMANNLPVLETAAFQHHQRVILTQAVPAHALVRCALLELANLLALQSKTTQGVFITDEARCAASLSGFPRNCLRVAPRAYLEFCSHLPVAMENTSPATGIKPQPGNLVEPDPEHLAPEVQASSSAPALKERISKVQGIRLPAGLSPVGVEQLLRRKANEVTQYAITNIRKKVATKRTQLANAEARPDATPGKPERKLVDYFSSKLG